MLKKLHLLVFVLFFSLHSQAYIVKPNETLANIIRKYYVKGKIFGKGGHLEKLLKINPEINDANKVPPGTSILLNKDLLIEGFVDQDDDTPETDVTDKEIEEDNAKGLNPFIEVEKYDAQKQALKAATSDKINFFVNFHFNNLAAKNRSTQSVFNFSTSNDTNIGFEYSKYLSELTSLIANISMSEFSNQSIATTTPNIEANRKVQAAGSLGARLLFAEGNFIDTAINYRPHYYLMQLDNGNLLLDHSPSSSLSIESENQFYNSKDFTVGLNLGFEYISNPKETGRGSADGSGYTAGLIYQQEFKDNDKLRVKFIYNQTSLDTSLYNLTNESISLHFLYSLPY